MADYTPTVSYSSIVERLRRAFGLVGDVPIAPKPDLLNVVRVADLTSPGHASFRGRRFAHWAVTALPAALSYQGIKAADTVVLTSMILANNIIASTYDLWILPASLADGGAWAWNTNVPFVERVASPTDWAPVQRITVPNTNPPAVAGLPLGSISLPNGVSTQYEILGEPIVLQAGDRVILRNAAVGPTATLSVAGYVF